jgi:hypothetical protein
MSLASMLKVASLAAGIVLGMNGALASGEPVIHGKGATAVRQVAEHLTIPNRQSSVSFRGGKLRGWKHRNGTFSVQDSEGARGAKSKRDRWWQLDRWLRLTHLTVHDRQGWRYYEGDRLKRYIARAASPLEVSAR